MNFAEEEVVYGVTHSPNTWSPLWVNVVHFVEIGEVIKLTPGFFNKIRVVIDFGPGYNYEVLKATHPEQVKRDKFDKNGKSKGRKRKNKYTDNKKKSVKK